jgi:hypothetical protein
VNTSSASYSGNVFSVGVTLTRAAGVAGGLLLLYGGINKVGTRVGEITYRPGVFFKHPYAREIINNEDNTAAFLFKSTRCPGLIP